MRSPPEIWSQYHGETRALIGFPRYKRVHRLLHELWTSSAGFYDKDRDKPRWMELEAAIVELARLGLGAHEDDASEAG